MDVKASVEYLINQVLSSDDKLGLLKNYFAKDSKELYCDYEKFQIEFFTKLFNNKSLDKEFKIDCCRISDNFGENAQMEICCLMLNLHFGDAKDATKEVFNTYLKFKEYLYQHLDISKENYDAYIHSIYDQLHAVCEKEYLERCKAANYDSDRVIDMKYVITCMFDCACKNNDYDIAYLLYHIDDINIHEVQFNGFRRFCKHNNLKGVMFMNSIVKTPVTNYQPMPPGFDYPISINGVLNMYYSDVFEKCCLSNHLDIVKYIDSCYPLKNHYSCEYAGYKWPDIIRKCRKNKDTDLTKMLEWLISVCGKTHDELLEIFKKDADIIDWLINTMMN